MNASLSQTASALFTGFSLGRHSRVNCAMCSARHLPGAEKPHTCRRPQCQGWQQHRVEMRVTRLRDMAALALMGLAALSPALDLLA